MAGLFLLGIFTRRANAPGSFDRGRSPATVVLYLVQSYTASALFSVRRGGNRDLFDCRVFGELGVSP